MPDDAPSPPDKIILCFILFALLEDSNRKDHDCLMTLLFLTFLAAFYCLFIGRERPALALIALMLVAMLAILIWEATTPLNLVF